MDHQFIRLFQTTEPDASSAALALYAGIYEPELELVLFFCSSKYNLDVLGQEINRLFSGEQVIGCTSAGEIGPNGYQHDGLVAMGFRKGSCVAACDILCDLKRLDIPKSFAFTQSLLKQMECKVPKVIPEHSFAIMMIDGLSMREEIVSHTFQLGLNKIPLIGGSAGDDQYFSQTCVYYRGRFHPDSAVLAVISTHLPFKIFRSQHLISTDERMVVTHADTAKRIVKEINGRLAADAYASAIGVSVSDLTPELFAANPVVIRIDGQEYVRSIQQLNDDASLTFYCAIDEGLVLRIAKCGDIKLELEKDIKRVCEDIGSPQVILTFECIHRNLEALIKGSKEGIDRLFKENRTLGFCTYGEQMKGIHLNQTMVAVAIGEARDEYK